MLYRRTEKEYRRFHHKMMNQSKTALWDGCHKVLFYSTIKEYFEYQKEIPEKYLKVLLSYSHPIEMMWEIYLKYEEISIETWDGIEDLLEAVVKIGGKLNEFCETGAS